MICYYVNGYRFYSISHAYKKAIERGGVCGKSDGNSPNEKT